MVTKSDIRLLLEDGPEQASNSRKARNRRSPPPPAGHARRRDDAQFDGMGGIGPLPAWAARPDSADAVGHSFRIGKRERSGRACSLALRLDVVLEDDTALSDPPTFCGYQMIRQPGHAFRK
jgi:hypothetical protein